MKTFSQCSLAAEEQNGVRDYDERNREQKDNISAIYIKPCYSHISMLTATIINCNQCFNQIIVNNINYSCNVDTVYDVDIYFTCFCVKIY